MAGKRYYWLKLRTDFFEQKEIKKLRRIAGGDSYVVIYLKLMLLAVKAEGKVMYEGFEDSFAEELALDINENAEDVSVVLSFMERYGLIEQGEVNEYILPETVSAIGSETAGAERVRRLREKRNTIELQKTNRALHCNADVTNV